MNSSAHDHDAPTGALHAPSRLFRIIAGAAMLAYVMSDVMHPQPLGWVSVIALVAIYPVLSGMVGWELLLPSTRKHHHHRTPFA